MSWRLVALTGACVLAFCWDARAVTVERLISREQREMEVTGRHLAVGRDGHVYVMTHGYVLRFNRDGTGKVGFRASHATWDVAANTDGVVAVACGHMDGSVRLYNRQLEEQLAARGEFANSDKLGWMSPCDIQTGPSGDFYAPDQHRGRIVRLDARGRKVRAYSLKATGENYVWYLARMRLAEPLERFYVVYYGRGEEIPVTAIVRCGDAKVPAGLSLSLRDEQGGGEALRLAPGDLKWSGATARGRISRQASSALRPGRYLLTASAEGLTVAPQVLVIGPGLRERPVFHIVQGGDGAVPPARGDPAVELPDRQRD